MRLQPNLHLRQKPLRYAVFQRDLSRDVPEDFGATEFFQIRDEIARQLGWVHDLERAKKNPEVLERVIVKLKEQGKSSPVLDAIVENVRRL